MEDEALNFKHNYIVHECYVVPLLYMKYTHHFQASDAHSQVPLRIYI